MSGCDNDMLVGKNADVTDNEVKDCFRNNGNEATSDIGKAKDDKIQTDETKVLFIDEKVLV